MVGVVGEAEVDEPVEVDGGDAVAEPEPVAVGAAVAEPAVGAAYEPGDAAFDHGPVAPVGIDGAVAAGNLTEERAGELKANLPEMAERFVNHTRPTD